MAILENSDGETSYDELNKMKAKSSRLARILQVKERIIRFEVADGYAHYQVTKLRPLTVKWIQTPDKYQAPDAFIRGLKMSDVLEHLEKQDRRYV